MRVPVGASQAVAEVGATPDAGAKSGPKLWLIIGASILILLIIIMAVLYGCKAKHIARK